jgi:type IV pilus assembly protein PilW
MSSEPRAPCSARQRGASIIEVMVGLVVALLVGLAATTSAVTFTAQQRQGVGVGGAAVNSTTVMTALRDDIAMAGLGFFGESAYLCPRLNLSVGATVLVNGAPFAPLQVRREVAGDVLDVVYGSRVESGAAVRVDGAPTAVQAMLGSFLPVEVGQAVLLTPRPAAGAGAPPCLMRSVTAQVASTPTTPQRIDFAAAGQHNAAVFATPSVFDDTGRVTDIGQLQWSRYRVDDQQQLVLERPLTGARAVVARDVIGFRVQYGVSSAAAGSTSMENWVDPTGAFASLDAANLRRVRAIRIALIVRSPQRQKPAADGSCDATLTMPEPFPDSADGGGVVVASVGGADEWKCWRYRTTTAVVPLRNVVLGLR